MRPDHRGDLTTIPIVFEDLWGAKTCGTTKLGSPPLSQIGNCHDRIFVPNSHLYDSGQLRLGEVDRTFSWYLVKLRATKITRDYMLEYYGHIDSTIRDMQDYAIFWETREMLKGKKSKELMKNHLQHRFQDDPEALSRLGSALARPRFTLWRWRLRRALRWGKRSAASLPRAIVG